jgi:hypothetical protein
MLTAFISVTLLFFAWGFVTSLNDPLIAAVKRIFSLNDTEGSLTQFAFFIAYGVVSIPAGRLVARSGYGLAIVYGLLAMLLGCLIMPLASRLNGYWIVLVALFVIASGMTVLQVAANPLSAALGPPALSHFRLTLSQFCNSIGTVLGPYLRIQGIADRRRVRGRRDRPRCRRTRRVAAENQFGLPAAGGVHRLAGHLCVGQSRALLRRGTAIDCAAVGIFRHAFALGAVWRRGNISIRRRRSLDRQSDDQLPEPGQYLWCDARTRRQIDRRILLGRRGRGAPGWEPACSHESPRRASWQLPRHAPRSCA